MKRYLLFLPFLCFTFSVIAQDLAPVKLNAPNKKRATTLMQALEKRQSTREFSPRKLSQQDLSDLLWAANGLNRPAEGKRTAPTAMNAQEIDVYVCLPEGAYRYDAKQNTLQPVAKGDFRPLVAKQQGFVTNAPLCLVIVADISRFKGDDNTQKLMMAAMDSGIVSQNISLFCAANNLATVPRATMDQGKLKTALKLKDSEYLLMNHPVGYMK